MCCQKESYLSNEHLHERNSYVKSAMQITSAVSQFILVFIRIIHITKWKITAIEKWLVITFENILWNNKIDNPNILFYLTIVRLK